MGRDRYMFGEAALPHFLTCAVVGWLPVFTRPEAAQVLLDSWKFLHDRGRMSLLGYVILENHIHCIASSGDLPKEVGDFKTFTARAILGVLDRRGDRSLLAEFRARKPARRVDRTFQVWQEGSHPQEILSEDMLRQKLEYIHNNPVRRGYVDLPEHWRYSSARNYTRLGGLVPVVTDW
jgi:REP element-mobilizing transposase RayT